MATVAARITMIWSRRSVVKMRLNVVIACPGRREGDFDRPVASTGGQRDNSVIATGLAQLRQREAVAGLDQPVSYRDFRRRWRRSLKDEIIAQLPEVRAWGGQFAVPAPDLTIIS